VHNGIIENFQELRDELGASAIASRARPTPRRWRPDHPLPEAGLSPREAAGEGVPAPPGRFRAGDPLRWRARPADLRAPQHPLAIGFGDGEMYLGSDSLALAPLTRRILYLDEGDWAVVTAAGATVYDEKNREVKARDPRDRALGALIGKATTATSCRRRSSSSRW